MSCRVSKEAFHNIVEKALEELPEQFSEALETMTLEVRDYPTRKMLQDAELGDGFSLLGLYHGRPLTERSVHDTGAMPDVIYLFQRELEALCDSPEDLQEEIRKTLLHELGHYFGLDEEDLERLGYS
jgi:predicted Zn-dependent protease with MMP-like domain